MEGNTVTLKLSEFDDLRDFKKNVEDGKYYVIKYREGVFGIDKDVLFYTKEVIFEEYEKANRELNENVQELDKKLNNVYDLSLWQFLKIKLNR